MCSAAELSAQAGYNRPPIASLEPLGSNPRGSCFGSPLNLSRIHWVRPEVVAEVTYLTWKEDNLLREVSYQGQREDKPAQAGRSSFFFRYRVAYRLFGVSISVCRRCHGRLAGGLGTSCAIVAVSSCGIFELRECAVSHIFL